MLKRISVFLTLIVLSGICAPGLVGVAFAQTPLYPAQPSGNYANDLELARRFVPVLYFHPDEIYTPQPVDVLSGITRMRQSKRLWFDTTILNNVAIRDLSFISTDSTYFLDQWFGDTGSSEYANYLSHQFIYESTLSPNVGGPQSLAYAHVVRNEVPGYITVQYWLFYFYNDWFNKHEGDWELVQVILSADEQPLWVVYSQHHGGVRRPWASTSVEEKTHPVVYVARGSHANYFAGNEVFPFPQTIGNRQFVLVDRTGSSTRTMPGVVLIPTRAELTADPDGWPGAEWLAYYGRWGETAVYSDFNGPTGPADKGLQWENPYVWGIGQPLDLENWYKNRFRLEVSGLSQAQVWLADENGQAISQSESFQNLAILHNDPPAKIQAHIVGTPGASPEVIVNWPDRLSETVTRTSFSGLVLDATGRASLELSAGQAIALQATDPVVLSPQTLRTYQVIWDAPDLVWVGPHLPFHEILAGLLLSLLFSLIPVLFLIAILYWVDQYHKGPLRLLAIAFTWGAIPALLVSFAVQLFVRLPPNLMGPHALEVIRLGLIAPVLEEALKATGVLFVFWRYRREFTDVLDGMIYGAIVGFGFAFISNLFRYAGDFLSLGMPALNLGFVVVRTVHVLNHGLYTAIFGTAVGFAIATRSRLRFWSIIAIGLVLAIATHALQNLLSDSLVGLNIFTVIVTSAGTLLLWAVAGWSLINQRRILRQELAGVLHDSLYASIQDPFARAKAQWNTLRHDGVRTWVKLRRLQGLCIKLANVRLRRRMDPNKVGAAGESDELLAEIESIFNGLR